MNGLIKVENIKTMTSLEIAKITNKRHDNIIRDINDEISKLGIERGQLIFEEIEYLDNRNRKQPAFNITLDGVLQLGARYDAVIRFNLIQKVKELQEKVPHSYPDALRALAIEVETKEKLMLENKELETKLDYSKEWYSVKRVAQLNHVSWKTFDWRKLKDSSISNGFPPKKIFDANYGEVNVYHNSIWERVYPEYEL